MLYITFDQWIHNKKISQVIVLEACLQLTGLNHCCVYFVCVLFNYSRLSLALSLI